MWPLSQMFSIGDLGFEGEVVNHACGNTSLVSGVNTIPGVSGGQAGDVQIIVFAINTNGTPAFPTPDDNDWRPLYTSGVGTSIVDYFNPSLGNGGWSANIQAWWRVLTGASQNFVSTQASGTLQITWFQSLLRGIDTDFLIYGLFNGANRANNAEASYTQNPAWQAEANDGDLLISWCGQAALAAITGAEPAVAGDVLQSCRITTNAPDSVWAMQRHGLFANNLLPDTETLSSWNLTGATVSLSPSVSTRAPDWRLAQTAGVSRHYASCNINLESGKWYAFGIAYRMASTNGAALQFTFVKPSDSSEHGAGTNYAGNVIVGYGTDVSTNDVSRFWGMNTGGGLASVHHEIRFQAPETGTFEIRLGIGLATSLTNLSPNGNTSNVIDGGMIYLCELPSQHHCASWMDTTTPVLPGSSKRLMPVGFVGQTREQNGCIIAQLWKNTDEAPPLCRLISLNAPSQAPFNDGFSLTGTHVLQANTAGQEYFVGLQSSHCVHKYRTAGQKFYAEYTVDNIGSVTTDYGLAVMCGLRSRVNTSPVGADVNFNLGEQLGMYAYTPNGTTYLHGASEGVTCSTYTTGDIVGVGIDLVNGEINWYLNGSLERTQTIADATFQTRMPWFVFTGVQNGNNQAADHQYTVNFRGPFGGRKPSGYIAFDHGNEIP